jgi:hypothetical protein
MTAEYMVRYLVLAFLVREVITGMLAILCALAGLTLFRVPMWQ